MRSRVVLFLSLAVIAGVAVTTTTYSAPEYQLTRRHVFPGFGFSIAYPEGWLAGTGGSPSSFTTQLKADHERLTYAQIIFAMGPPVRGYAVILHHRPLSYFPWPRGVPTKATHNDLQELFAHGPGGLQWEKPIEVGPATLFGVAARRIKAQSRLGWGIHIMGFIKDEGFLLTLLAPTRQALNAFEPTWTRMLKSIQRVK